MANRRQKTIVVTWRLAVFSLLLGCSFLTGCSTLTETFASLTRPFTKDDTAEPEAIEDSGPRLAYEVELAIAGNADDNKRLRDFLHESSTSLRLKDRPTATLAGLQRRAEEDTLRFTEVLQSFGYYDGKVSFTIRPKSGAEDVLPAPGSPAVVLFAIDSGPPYLLAQVELEVNRPDLTVRRPMKEAELKLAGLTTGKPAEAEAIIQAEQQAVEIIRAGGYPLARAGDRKVTAHTGEAAEKTLNVTFAIITGEKANFGPVTVKGATEVDPDFIAGYRTWQQGELFSPEEVATTRRELVASNLFLAADVRPAAAVGDQGEIPIEIEVTERKHRTIGGGIDYSTADGIGGNAFWEHRNLFGAGEKLRLHLEASQLQYGFETDFAKPQFLRRRQLLVADGQGKEFTTDAYEGELADGFVGIERRFMEYWAATLGMAAEYSDLTGPDSPNEYFFLGGLRGKLRRDSTSNPLDPTDGSRLELAVSPLASLAGANTGFTTLLFTGSSYLPLDEARRYVLAGRARAGTVFGEERSALPSNKRFYAGGGGSIRGYEYQKVGPLDAENDPIGGRSLVEAGVELRARVTESIGVVPFIEGGNVFESSEPEDFDLLWAAGLGLRYYTAVGPLRFDFAVPLDQRDIDDDFQIYLSIGQAF